MSPQKKIDWTDPFGIVFGNMVGAMPPDRRPLGNKILERLVEKLLAKGGGVLLAVEADDAAVRKLIDPKVFWVRHRPQRFLDGVLIVGTWDRTEPRGQGRWVRGAPASVVNDPRPLLLQDVIIDDVSEPVTFGVGHLPKPKGGATAAKQMFGEINRHDPDAFFADFNLRGASIRRRLPGYRVQSREVVGGAARPDAVKLGRMEHFDILKQTDDDDHPGLYVPGQARMG